MADEDVIELEARLVDVSDVSALVDGFRDIFAQSFAQIDTLLRGFTTRTSKGVAAVNKDLSATARAVAIAGQAAAVAAGTATTAIRREVNAVQDLAKAANLSVAAEAARQTTTERFGASLRATQTSAAAVASELERLQINPGIVDGVENITKRLFDLLQRFEGQGKRSFDSEQLKAFRIELQTLSGLGTNLRNVANAGRQLSTVFARGETAARNLGLRGAEQRETLAVREGVTARAAVRKAALSKELQDNAAANAVQVVDHRKAVAAQLAETVKANKLELASFNLVVKQRLEDDRRLTDATKSVVRIRSTLAATAAQKERTESRTTAALVVAESRRRTSAFVESQRQSTASLQGGIKERLQASTIEGRRQAQIIKGQVQQEIIIKNQAAQQSVIQTKVAGQQRVQASRFVLEQISKIERTIGSIVRATYSGASAVIRTFANTAGSALSSVFRRQSGDIKAGNLSAERELRSSYARRERDLLASATRQSRIITDAQTQARTGVLGALGKNAGGLAGLLGGGALLTAGFSRFSDLERLTAQFKALIGSASGAKTVLAQLTDFAKKTPFDLVGVADLAKGFLAIGTSTEDLLPRIRAISDAVAFTGGGVDAINRIQRAIGQVVSAGRLQGDELNQLAENLPGLNIRKILADQLTGGDVQQLVALQEAGKITADQFVVGLTEGLASDPRLAGASEALALTVGGRLANLKESFADFGASLVGTVATPLKFLFASLQFGLQSTADFIRGENLSPTLEVIRKAAAGAALAIGGLIVAKGAAESLQLLGKAAKLAFTPFGAGVLALAALGAGFKLLLDRSAPFRAAVSQIAERLAPLVQRFKELVGLTSGAGQGLINDRVLPFIDKVGAFLGDRLVPAFDAAISKGEQFAAIVVPKISGALKAVISAAQSVVDFIRPRLGPAFDAVQRLAVAGFNKIKAGLISISPFVVPVVEALRTVGDAFSSVFSGDFNKAGAGLRSGGSALAAAIVAPLSVAFQGIKGLFDKFVAPLFTSRNLLALAKGGLKVVEELARLVTLVVTDPKLLAAIAAAALAIGAALLKGIVRGLASNFAELTDFVALALPSAFRNVGAKIIQVLILGFAGFKAVKALFSKLGNDSGTALADGVTRGARLTGLRSFFGGVEGVARSNAQAAQRAIIQEFNKTNTILRGAGQPLLPRDAFGKVGATELDKANKATERLTRQIGSAGVKAAELRGRMVEISEAVTGTAREFGRLSSGVGKGFRQIDQGVTAGITSVGRGFLTVGKQVASNLSAGLKAGSQNLAAFLSNDIANPDAYTKAAKTGSVSFFKTLGASFKDGYAAAAPSIKQGFSTIRSSFGAAFESFKSDAESEGRSVGGRIGTSIAAGLAGAVGAVAAGKALGSGNTFIGLSGIALSAIGTGAAVGGPLGAAAGVGVAGVGLLTAAFTASKKKADEFKQGVAELSATIKTQLQQAAADGKISIDQIKDGLSFKELNTVSFDPLATEFKKLGESNLDFFDNIGGSVDRTIIPALEAAGDSANNVRTSIIDAASASGFFQDAFGKNASKVEEFVRQQAALGKVSESTLANLRLVTESSAGAADGITNGSSLVPLLDLINAATDRTQTLKDSLASVSRDARIFEPPKIDAIKIKTEFTSSRDLQAEFDAATSRIDVGNQALDKYVGLLKEAFNPDSSNIGGVINDQISALRGFGGQFNDLFAKSLSGDVFDTADFNNSLASLGDRISDVLGQGLREGVVLNEADARALSKPLIDAALVGVNDPAARQAIIDFFDSAITDSLPIIADNAALLPGIVQAELDKKNIEVELEVRAKLAEDTKALKRNVERNLGFVTIPAIIKVSDTVRLPDLSQLLQIPVSNPANSRRNSVDSGGRFGSTVQAPRITAPKIDFSKVSGSPSPSDLARIQLEGSRSLRPPSVVGGVDYSKLKGAPSAIALAKLRLDGQSIGANIVLGVTQGIQLNAVRAVQAAQNLANSVTQTVKRTLKIFSPSRVFFDIGVNIGKGLAGGITGSIEEVTDSARSAVQESIAAAVSEADKRKAQLGAANSELFTALTNSTAVQQTRGLFDARGQFTSAVDAIKAKAQEETKNFSLDVTSVGGAQNIGSFEAVADSIREVIGSLLESGTPASQAITQAGNLLQQAIDAAASVGFQAGDVASLLEKLGLSAAQFATFAAEAAKLEKERSAEIDRLARVEAAKKSATPAAAVNPITNYYQTVQVQAPTNDPIAIALAVANRLALQRL